MTLRAVGGGTATITVSIGFLTDSFEVTVTPSLKSVTITNKASLVSWRDDEEATRSLELAFSPAEIYNFDNSDVIIASNNPEVVSVDGTTLTRMGRGVATITVAAKGGVTDEVTISVLPPEIQSITVSNKADLEADWESGTERTINATFDPGDYNTSNTTPTITCDPAGAIEVVDGWIIRAKAVGTATVTVEEFGQNRHFHHQRCPRNTHAYAQR